MKQIFCRSVALCAVTIFSILAVGENAFAKGILVNSLKDPTDIRTKNGKRGGAITFEGCTLHDAIIASQTGTRTHGCPAGSGNDTIVFRFPGTIHLADSLPLITKTLIIHGIAKLPAVSKKFQLQKTVTIDGGGAHPIMEVVGSATLTMDHLTFQNGFSADGGGAIVNHGHITVTDGEFIANKSGLTQTGTGGAIQNNSGASLAVSTSAFSGNSALVGGAIASGGPMTISDSSFTNNSVAAGGLGGGIYNVDNLTMTGCTIAGGSADFGGGIFNDGTVVIVNSTMANNAASENGGAIDNTSHIHIINSTIAVNRAPNGNGGGIWNFNQNGTNEAQVKATIFASNVGSDCGPPSPLLTDQGYNIADDASCSFSDSTSHNSLEPMLDPDGLLDNGGPTRTIALVEGSPAIDQIPFNACLDQNSQPLKVDQRGEPRPDPEDGANGPCDIGAYEFQDSN